MFLLLVSVLTVAQCVSAWIPPYQYGCPCYNPCHPSRPLPHPHRGCGCHHQYESCEKKKPDCYDDDDGNNDNDPVNQPVTCPNPCTLPPADIRDKSVHLEVVPNCPASDAKCYFHWNITQMMTMMIYNTTNGTGIPIIYKNGCFLKIMGNNITEPATLEDLAQVIQVDGTHKYVMAVNRQVPGPTMVAYENQTAVIVVHNDMISEGTGIHWHGLFQKDTPWMDGVTSVSQCPINIQETFVYKFNQTPCGTQWYHSHTALQRSNGLFGAYIILPVTNRTDLPIFEKDFVAVFHDWHLLRCDLDFHSFLYGFQDYIKDDFNSSSYKYPVGTVINGKGMFGSEHISPCWNTITTYKVKQHATYRFRFLNSGASTPYAIEIEGHNMIVIASDGSPLKPFRAHYVVVHIGERYDVYIRTNQRVDNYWITFRAIHFDQFIPDQVGYAILQYEGANTNLLPSNHQKNCTVNRKCVMSNCITKEFDPKGHNFTCISIGDMNSTGDYNYFDIPDTADDNSSIETEDRFLVFGFTNDGFLNSSKASINAMFFEVPSKPPQVFRKVDFDHPCNITECISKPCTCTHMIKVTKGALIYMVFASTAGSHPVHMHAHDYQVVKVVYGKNTTGLHPNLTCTSSDPKDPKRCIQANWTNSTWSGGNVPGIKTKYAPEKDTTVTPGGGYVVVRFIANNPGWWMLHCHIEFHLAEGMGVIMQEGEPEDMTPPPPGFATCGTFTYGENITQNQQP